MALSQGTISTVARLSVRAMVLLIVLLRKSIVAKCSQYGESTTILLPVSVGHSGQEPLCLREACANLAQNSGCLKTFKGQNYTQQITPWPITIQNPFSLYIHLFMFQLST